MLEIILLNLGFLASVGILTSQNINEKNNKFHYVILAPPLLLVGACVSFFLTRL